ARGRAAPVSDPGEGAGQRAGCRRRLLPRAFDTGRGLVTLDPTHLTISELRHMLDERELSAQELLGLHLERIEAADADVKAFLRLTTARAAEQAQAADRALRDGTAGPLAGIPMAVKDVLCVKGVETTAGSQILKGFKPPYTGTAVQRLFDAGAVMLGVTNCDEFAMGSSTE